MPIRFVQALPATLAGDRERVAPLIRDGRGDSEAVQRWTGGERPIWTSDDHKQTDC